MNNFVKRILKYLSRELRTFNSIKRIMFVS